MLKVECLPLHEENMVPVNILNDLMYTEYSVLIYYNIFNYWQGIAAFSTVSKQDVTIFISYCMSFYVP